MYIRAVESWIKQLTPFLPPGAAGIIADWIGATNCEFRIARPRRSKLGDYRAPYGGKGHRISVNNNLNPYAFLVTTVHEFAHLKTWQIHGPRVKPHGKEWKAAFRQLMIPFLAQRILPDDIHAALTTYLENPAASSCSDLQLSRVLAGYDGHTHRDYGFVFLEKLSEGDYFTTRDGRIFRKAEKLRTRFRCTEVETQRIYLFSPIAEVLPQGTIGIQKNYLL